MIRNKRKSCAMARILSFFVSGLGLVYVGEIIKGFLWMIPVPFFLLLELLIIKLIRVQLEIGSPVARGGDAFIIIAIFYFIYSSYSAKESSAGAAQYNMRKALLENIDEL